jgi:hypothetical protein
MACHFHNVCQAGQLGQPFHEIVRAVGGIVHEHADRGFVLHLLSGIGEL